MLEVWFEPFTAVTMLFGCIGLFMLIPPWLPRVQCATQLPLRLTLIIWLQLGPALENDIILFVIVRTLAFSGFVKLMLLRNLG